MGTITIKAISGESRVAFAGVTANRVETISIGIAWKDGVSTFVDVLIDRKNVDNFSLKIYNKRITITI